MRKLKKYKPTKFMAKTSHYDKDAADYAVMFIESLCHTKGTWAGKPFELIDWQEQIIRDLFGVLKPNGYRQFNTAYIEIPKKQGKSELAAAVALLLLCGDGEERAEVYGCAADRNQAKIVFDVAVDMVRFCPALSKRVKILESQKKITYLPTNSSYQVLSADVANKHGFNTHGVIFDELHTQPNRKLFDVMLQGSGDARMQPLYFLITTAGNDTNSICYEVHQKAIDIAEGRKVDPTFYSVIYGAAENEDWTDPKVWKKANPSLGITVGIDKVRAACESARQNPGEENAFRQLRLNQWVKQSVRWMPMDKWDACAFPVSEDDLEGRICYGGLDLSSTTDITAFVLVFPPLDEEDKYYILPYFWIPEETLDLRVRRDHVPYDLWERQGTLMTTEGNVVHYEDFRDDTPLPDSYWTTLSGEWSVWRESYTTENRPYSLLEGSGKLAWKYEGFSDLHIRARVGFPQNGGGRAGVFLGNLFCCLNYDTQRVELYQGSTLLGSYSTSFSKTPDAQLHSDPAVYTIEMRKRGNRVRVYSGSSYTLRFSATVSATSGYAGIQADNEIVCDLLRAGDAWAYEPYECFDVVYPDGVRTSFGRIARSGVTWDEEFQIFSVNSDVDEGSTRSEDISLDYDFFHSHLLEISCGNDYTAKVIPRDINVWTARLFLGDADGFSILYYQDVDSLVYWANEAAYRWGLRGIAIWSLGQEDMRLWEVMPKQIE